MSTVRTFKVKVKCERNWPYENAVVAVRQWSQSSQETGVSDDCKGEYAIDSAIESISYRGNFWPDVQAKVDGLATRPLINLENPGDPQLFNVDLEHETSIKVRNSSLSTEDKRFRLIELDITRRYA